MYKYYFIHYISKILAGITFWHMGLISEKLNITYLVTYNKTYPPHLGFIIRGLF